MDKDIKEMFNEVCKAGLNPTVLICTVCGFVLDSREQNVELCEHFEEILLEFKDGHTEIFDPEKKDWEND